MTKNKSLDNVVNMVVSPMGETHSEVFIATEDGQFVRFKVGAGDLMMERMSLRQYLGQTQHYIASKANLKTCYGSIRP